MALEYGYFDSEIIGYDDEGMPQFDRAKTSDFMAKFFSSFIESGVMRNPSNSFQVVANGGMEISVSPGWAFLKGRLAYDEEAYVITLESAPAEVGTSRIDLIILRNNYAERKAEIICRTGTAASSPAEPELHQESSGDYYELCLAKIAVRAGISEISQAYITDTRYDLAYCGIVSGLLDQYNFNDFKLQYDGWCKDAKVEIMAWFETIKGQLSEDAAVNLQNQIDDANAEIARLGNGVVIKLSAASWSSTEPYSQAVALSGLQSTDAVKVYAYTPASLASSIVKTYRKMAAMITDAESEEGVLTIYCGVKKPTADFEVYVEGVSA